MLSKKYIALIAVVAVASIGLIPAFDIVAKEALIETINRVQYYAIHDEFIDMQPGETMTVPVTINAESAATIDLYVSEEGKEFEAIHGLGGEFAGPVSASLSMERSSFDSPGSENVEIQIMVSPDAQPGTYPITLAMKQQVIGGSNLLQQYIYVTVE